jgi:hypothetical protein
MAKAGVDIPRHLVRKVVVNAVASVVRWEATEHQLEPKQA